MNIHIKKSTALCLITALIFSLCTSAVNVFASSGSDFKYEVFGDGYIRITDYTGSDSAIGIPSEINGRTVTGIAKAAFSKKTAVTSITIPSSVSEIGDNAFTGCSGLTSILVNSGSLYFSASNGVLFNKDKTVLIAYPNGKAGTYSIPNTVTSIGYSAFDSCKKLTGITIPDSVTSIDVTAFYGCVKLAKLKIPASVDFDSEAAFADCTELTSVKIDEGVSKIGEAVFLGCSNLSDVNIPRSANLIEDYAFSDCISLESIAIPKTVTKIGDYAFGFDLSGAARKPVANFIVYGFNNSTAHNYATANELNFIRLTLGDVTRDEDINIFDIMAVRNYIFGKRNLTQSELLTADATEDGEINIFDIMSIRNHIFGSKLLVT